VPLGRGSAKDRILHVVEGNRLVEQMDNRPFRIQIAKRLRFLFGLGSIAIEDFVLVNDRASQEARFFVIVIDDYFSMRAQMSSLCRRRQKIRRSATLSRAR
jgi:hypothetical protein